MLAVLPLAYANLRQPLSRHVYAFDSCLSGAAINKAPIPTRAASTILRYAECRGSDALLNAGLLVDDHITSRLRNCLFAPPQFGPWTLVFRWPWGFSEHITFLETRTLLNLVRHLARSSRSNMRIPIFGDNCPSLGVLIKGRSSSRRLNRLARRVAAHVLVLWLWLYFLFCRSGLNPSDLDSRFWEHG